MYKSLAAKRVSLPNGWSLTPPGRSLDLDDLPLNLVVSPTKKYLAVTNNGQSTQSITLLDAHTEQILDTAKVAKAYLGLAFSDDETRLYASGGNDNKILVYRIENQKPDARRAHCAGQTLARTNFAHGLVSSMMPETESTSSLKKIARCIYADTKTRQILHKLNLGAAAYTCMLSPDKKELFISLWGGASVLVINR